MVFNSWVFAFGFLPITLVGFYLLQTHAPVAAKAWLGIASLFFYGWWSPGYVLVLIASTIVNFYAAQLISAQPFGPIRRRITAVTIAANLGLLAYFKYTGFFIETLNSAFGLAVIFHTVVLPLGISFFTFQKIAYLADIHAGQPAEKSPIDFLLFVAFFPQLIAGPIVHHREVLPQFARVRSGGPDPTDLSVGLTLFGIGLFKKTMLADPIGAHAKLVFEAAERAIVLTTTEAWLGALAYSFQLYFDFSGYSDMAIGLARMFGVRLPLNFASPYKSLSIIEFWRRWHITLSRFLRDYVYIPLGGNRHGPIRRYFNIAIVMLVGGFWHGAGWTFIIWGALHCCYLLINHAWRTVAHLRRRGRGLGVLPGADRRYCTLYRKGYVRADRNGTGRLGASRCFWQRGIRDSIADRTMGHRGVRAQFAIPAAQLRTGAGLAKAHVATERDRTVSGVAP
jgi:alginate O-acetyltransferase complex protein AlgI